MKTTKAQKQLISCVLRTSEPFADFAASEYTRSPLEDSRLFGHSPWKILAATNEQKHV